MLAEPLLFVTDPSVFETGRLVHFQYYHPSARSVCVRGVFTGRRTKTIRLRHLGGGAWVVSLLLPPGRYAYHFLVDGQWQPDSLATDLTEGPAGSLNSVTVVG